MHARANSDDATTAMRAARLLDYIKTETRWQLLARGTLMIELSMPHVAEERRALVATWADIRNRRVEPAFLVNYYEFASDQALRFALLIAIRRQREFMRKVF
jgi:hypothetical protein